jgi:predicted metallo-beta-lactamase superfamily hydrolase
MNKIFNSSKHKSILDIHHENKKQRIPLSNYNPNTISDFRDHFEDTNCDEGIEINPNIDYIDKVGPTTELSMYEDPNDTTIQEKIDRLKKMIDEANINIITLKHHSSI